MLNATPWILLGLPSALALAEFFVPGPPPYPRWTAGDVQEIRYRTTYTEYTIALWQQFDGSAKLGPILFQTTNGPDGDFDWVVQSYDLDLDISDEFFLWLYEGGPSAQGNSSIENQQSSGFFTISEETTTTTITSSVPSSSTISSTSAPSTTSSDSEATSDVPLDDSNTSGGGISTAAKAGIGVGAGVGVLAIIAAILLFFRYRSKKKKEMEGLRQGNDYSNSYGLPFGNIPKTTGPSTTTTLPPSHELPTSHNREMSELG